MTAAMPFWFLIIALTSALTQWLWERGDTGIAFLTGLWTVCCFAMTLLSWFNTKYTTPIAKPKTGIAFALISLAMAGYAIANQHNRPLLTISFITGFIALGYFLEYLHHKAHQHPAPQKLITLFTSTFGLVFIICLAIAAPFIIALATSLIIALLPVLALILVIIAALLVIRAFA